MAKQADSENTTTTDALDLIDEFDMRLNQARGVIGCAVSALLTTNTDPKDLRNALEGANKLLGRASKKAHALYEMKSGAQ